jgi:protein ImuB
VLPAPVTAVRLAVLTTAPITARQQELFVDLREQGGPRELGRLVDRLSSRLGCEAVVRPVLVADAQPAYACRYEPLTGQPNHALVRQQAAQKKPAAKERAWRRVLRLEPRPIPLAVRTTITGAMPEYLRWRGHEEHITRAWGPERIYTGWWRRRTVRRDYYRVETSTGHRLWLFRRLGDGRWFLHGRFD